MNIFYIFPYSYSWIHFIFLIMLDVSFSDNVTLMLSGGPEGAAKEKLVDKQTVIKHIATEFKKPGADKS